MLFRPILLFLSFVSHIFTFLYISYLTLPTKEEQKRDLFPPSSGTTATSLQLLFHCDCVLHLVLQLLAIDLRPLIVFSIEFLSHFYRIASLHITSHCAPRIAVLYIE